MKLSELPPAELVARLKGPGLHIETGPFIFLIRTDLAKIVTGLTLLYPDFHVLDSEGFPDFELCVTKPRGLRHWLKPQVVIYVNGEIPSLPLPVNQAFAVFEGCLNWCIYTHAHQYFIIHAACVERGGRAVLLPAPPGSGKSTLCAALVHRGWRLLTDELTLIDSQTCAVIPMARPISLKNESIDVIQNFAPEAVFGPVSPNTIKGTIAHVRPPLDSVARAGEASNIVSCIFPRFRPDGRLVARPVSRAQSFMQIAVSAVNYTLLGAQAFNSLAQIVDMLNSYELEYSDLNQAVAWFNELN